MPNLQTLLSDFTFESLPPAWTTGDLAAFSRGKSLWDYQQAALRNAITVIWLYYDGVEGAARSFNRYRDNSAGASLQRQGVGLQADMVASSSTKLRRVLKWTRKHQEYVRAVKVVCILPPTKTKR